MECIDINWLCIDINWLCKHRKKVRSSQASISNNSCTKLSKTQFFLLVSLIQSLSPINQLYHLIFNYLNSSGNFQEIRIIWYRNLAASDFFFMSFSLLIFSRWIILLFLLHREGGDFFFKIKENNRLSSSKYEI